MKKVREGYKMTELGEIPEDWTVTKLENKVEIRSGNSPSTFNLVENGRYPFFKVDDMNYTDKYLSESKVYFNEENYNLMPEGMVVFPKRGASIFTNKVAILDKDGYFDTNIMGLKCKEGLYNEYLFYQLKFIELKKFADTTAVPQINNKHINPLQMCLPPVKEQQKISLILSSVDEQIEITNNLIEKTKELKKGLMQRLLTKGIGHSSFKDTEIGRIPEEWGIRKLGEVCEIKSSKRVYQSDYVEDGVPFYRSKEIIELSKGKAPEIELYISEEMYNNFEDKYGTPKKGDLLITSVGTIGKTWVSDGRKFYYKDGNITQIVKNNEIDVNFISYLFDSSVLKGQYLGQSSGSAQVALTIEKLNKLIIPFPNLKEQKQISLILSSVDKQIDQYESKKEKLQELKRGLMQKLLTGRIRVKV